MSPHLDLTNKVYLLLYIITVIVSFTSWRQWGTCILICVRITYFRVSLPWNRFHVPTDVGWCYLRASFTNIATAA